MSNYLEQIVFDGFAEKEGKFKVGKKEVTYTIRTLTHQQQMDIDKVMQLNADSNVIGAGHTYILEILARTLIELDGKKFSSAENCKEFLLSRPSTFVKILGQLQGELEKEIKDLLKPENIEETFTETPLTVSD